MPDKYRVLIGRDGKISQCGVLDFSLDQLCNELYSADMQPWIKDNVVNYWYEAHKYCLDCRVPVHEGLEGHLLNEDETFHICKD